MCTQNAFGWLFPGQRDRYNPLAFVSLRRIVIIYIYVFADTSPHPIADKPLVLITEYGHKDKSLSLLKLGDDFDFVGPRRFGFAKLLVV